MTLHRANGTEEAVGPRCGCNSVGRVLASQARCRGFESLHPLLVAKKGAAIAHSDLS